jgi:branched-chain amino acid transport system substrate-binding protein
MKHYLYAVSLFLCLASNVYAEIKIGWIGPLTGNAAILGTDTIPAIQIAFDEINSAGGIAGEKLRLIIEDDQYLTAKTVTAYNRLVRAEGIKVVFVLTYGGIAAIAPQAERDGVILIDTLDCDENMASLPPNTICIAKMTESMGRTVAQMIHKRSDFPSVVIYFDGDPFMGILADSLIKELKSSGNTPVLIETYNDNNTDFRSLALRIKALGEVKSIALLGYDQLGRAMRTIRDLGISAQFYGVNTAASPGFQELAGTTIEGMLGAAFRAPQSEALNKFTTSFITKVGHKWHFETSTIPSYDAARLLTSSLVKGALNSETKKIDIHKVRASLLDTKDYRGLSGLISVDADGVTRSIGVRAVKFSNGAFELIK